MSAKKRGLGRGLDALLGDNAVDSSDAVTLRLSEIEPNRDQPRRRFDDEALAELADSIGRYGLLQPITVRPVAGSAYQIVAGERRWRAARLAGLDSVPVIIRQMTDEECMAIALIENLQREDLNAAEEAEGYRRLMEQFELTQAEVAERVGKSRPAVANALRLLSLPDDILELVRDGRLSAGHARALVTLDESDRAAGLALALAGGSVRDIEKVGQRKKSGSATAKPAPTYYREVELALREALGRKVRVVGSGGKGRLELEFYSDEELTDLAQRLSADK